MPICLYAYNPHLPLRQAALRRNAHGRNGRNGRNGSAKVGVTSAVPADIQKRRRIRHIPMWEKCKHMCIMCIKPTSAMLHLPIKPTYSILEHLLNPLIIYQNTY
jgi:hypothetical protein